MPASMLGTTVLQGALISAVIGVALFISREAGRAMDRFAQLLGFIMLISAVAQHRAPG